MEEKDYKKLWDELKKQLEGNVEYYKKGIMCSLSESSWGESITKDVLTLMEKLEDGKDLDEELDEEDEDDEDILLAELIYNMRSKELEDKNEWYRSNDGCGNY